MVIFIKIQNDYQYDYQHEQVFTICLLLAKLITCLLQ